MIHRHKMIYLGFLLTLILQGCSSAPHHQVPELSNQALAFKEDEIWKNYSVELKPNAQWWLVLQDSNLNALMQQLEQGSANLAALAAQVQAAQALLTQAQASAYPTVNTSLTPSRAQTSGTTSVNTIGDLQQQTVIPGRLTTQYTAQVQLAWEVDVWGKLSAQAQAAQASLQATEADFQAGVLSAQALLAQSYFQWIANGLEEQRTQQLVSNTQRLLNLTRNRVKVGVGTPLDEVQVSAQLDTLRAQALDAELKRKQSENAIAVLLGQLPTQFKLTPLIDWPVLTPQMPQWIPSAYLQSRYDVLAAERRLAAANAQIGVAKAAFFPSLNLNVSSGFRATDWSKLLDAPAHFWSVGPSLALTLFDAGRRKAVTEQAIANHAQAAANYRQVALQAFQELEDNALALVLLERELNLQAQALEKNRRAVQIAENQYKAGTVDALQVLTVQNTYANSLGTFNATKNRQLQAYVLLMKHTGGRSS